MSVKDHPVMARLVQYQKVTLCFILLVSLQQVIPMKYGVEAACLNCLDAGIEMSYSVVPLSSPAGFVSQLHGSTRLRMKIGIWSALSFMSRISNN